MCRLSGAQAFLKLLACAVQEASRLDPGSAAIQQLLAVSRMSQGDIPDALVAFREAIKLKPDLREAYINMASALKEVGHWLPGVSQALIACTGRSCGHVPQTCVARLRWAGSPRRKRRSKRAWRCAAMAPATGMRCGRSQKCDADAGYTWRRCSCLIWSASGRLRRHTSNWSFSEVRMAWQSIRIDSDCQVTCWVGERV